VSPLAYALLFPAGVVAGFVGTTAGLASLISYPALLVAGLPPVTANVTNTVALFGSGVSSIAGSQQELRGEGRWLAGWAVMTAAEVVAMVHQEADDPAGPIEPSGRQVWLPQRGLGDRQGVDRVRLAVAAGTVTSLRHELGMHSDDAPAGLQTLNHAYAPRDARFTNRFPWSPRGSRSGTGCGCCCRATTRTTIGCGTSSRRTCGIPPHGPGKHHELPHVPAARPPEIKGVASPLTPLSGKPPSWVST
jgi:hypothetical protein